MYSDATSQSSFIEQWLHGIVVCLDQTGGSIGSGDDPNKRKRAPSPTLLVMSTPPASQSLSERRTGSSPKKRKLPVRSVAEQQDGDDVVFAEDDPVQTPRRSSIFGLAPKLPHPQPTALRQTAGQSESSAGYPATASIISSQNTNTSTKSRTRSVSPTKKTQHLIALQKPIHHIHIKDNANDQLPPDVRDLYNRLYDITVDHEAFLPWEVRDDICHAVGRKVKDSWFRKKEDNPPVGDGSQGAESTRAAAEEERATALAELNALRNLEHAAWECGELGRSEAAWNLEVHGPLLQLGLAHHGHASRELVTTAQISKPFLPPMNMYSAADYADKKMVDFVLVLDPDGSRHAAQAPEEGDTSTAQDRAEYAHLAKAIKQEVYSQPPGCQSINQTTYTPLLCRPIGVSIETKADGANEEGRIQLAIWVAAWHQRISHFLDKRRGRYTGMEEVDDRDRDTRDGKVITLPVLLIVEHSWVLSFVCDRGDKLEIVGRMPLGDTSSLLGLYTLLAVVRELGSWIEGPFRSWISDLLC